MSVYVQYMGRGQVKGSFRILKYKIWPLLAISTPASTPSPQQSNPPGVFKSCSVFGTLMRYYSCQTFLQLTLSLIFCTLHKSSYILSSSSIVTASYGFSSSVMSRLLHKSCTHKRQNIFRSSKVDRDESGEFESRHQPNSLFSSSSVGVFPKLDGKGDSNKQTIMFYLTFPV